VTGLILETLYASGIRLRELTGLNREDVDLEAGVMRIRGKGRKERLALLGTRQRKPSDSIFRGVAYLAVQNPRETRPLSWDAAVNEYTRGSSSASLTNMLLCAVFRGRSALTTSFRHTFATHLLEMGPIAGDSGAPGHESLSTTQRYTSVSVDRLMEIYDRAHPKGSGGQQDI
jgi:integrase/recombinase XerC